MHILKCLRNCTETPHLKHMLIHDLSPSAVRSSTSCQDVLLRLTMTDVPVTVAGDINIHLERHDESHSRHSTELLAPYGQQSRVKIETHDHGG
jgi:hypothetical protein